jgi:BirA family biotin operon repressor/biotin-[acetyl-CoA-carboxylase] ligase
VTRELASYGAREGTVVVAETQTLGKGRWGRRWQSPKGGLWFTLLLRPHSLRDLGLISLSAGIAAARTASSFCEVTLKWPNDVLIGSKKLGGILIEAEAHGSSYIVLVGIGMNLNIKREDISEDIRRKVASLSELTGRLIHQDEFLIELLGHLSHFYHEILGGVKTDLLSEYRSLCSSIGKEVKVKTYAEIVKGKAIDVDETGALLVAVNDNLTRHILFGEITSLEITNHWK